MSRGRLKPEDEKCIRLNYLYLKQNLEASDIVDYLYQHEVIVLEDKEHIKSGKTGKEQNEILLNTLLNAGPGEAFNYFLKSLEERHQHVLEKLKPTERQDNKEGGLLGEDNKNLRSENATLKRDNKQLQEEIEILKSEYATLRRDYEQLQAEYTILKSEKPKSKTENEQVVQEENDILKSENATLRRDFEQLQEENTILKCEIGTHETLMSLNGENDISKCYAECKENPGHINFIPVEAFNINDLLENFRTKSLYKLIQSLADLTVKIDVDLTSLNRPEFVQGRNVPYPFSDIRGTKIKRSGSGWVDNIIKIDSTVASDSQPRTCRCSNCQESGQTKTEFWQIHVSTAKQVINDMEEAKTSSVRLFYDKEDSPLILLKGCICHVLKSLRPNHSFIIYESCDVNMCKKLEKNVAKMNKYSEILQQKNVGTTGEAMFAIVSHPHGGSKKISIGRNQSIIIDHNGRKLLYRARTCPGSDGAIFLCYSMHRHVRRRLIFSALTVNP